MPRANLRDTAAAVLAAWDDESTAPATKAAAASLYPAGLTLVRVFEALRGLGCLIEFVACRRRRAGRRVRS